jgi:hypothetical protein
VPSPALIVACLALFAALGGGSYAATQIGSSSIHFTNAKLQHGWKQGCCVTGPPAYAKDSLGVVHLRGGLKSGTAGSPAFVLPKALRPTHALYLSIWPPGDSLVIATDGTVTPNETDNALISLAGINFPASS